MTETIITPSREQVIKQFKEDYDLANKQLVTHTERVQYWKAIKEDAKTHLERFGCFT